MKKIPVANPQIGEAEAKAAYDVISSGWVSMGQKVREFETKIESFTGAKYAVAMNNGTSTLQSCLATLGIGPGDEVIIPTLSYISSANVVLYQGATPIFCDSNVETFNVDVEHIKSKITPRTKAFMTVDLKGLPVDYDAFSRLSAETGIPFVSDSAESFGASYKGARVGTQALLHSFSFFANKNITTGEGGVVLTNDKSFAEKLKIIRNQGQEGRYNHTVLGNNFRMTDVQAAIGMVQLSKIDRIIGDKKRIALLYDKMFAEQPGIVTPVKVKYENTPSWYLYSIKVKNELRDPLVNFLEQNGIETRLSFPPIHQQPFYAARFKINSEQFPGASKAFCEFLDIPIWCDMPVIQTEIVANKILSFMKRAG